MINLHHLVIGYRGRPVCAPLQAQIASASMTAIIGANGCGKSTLLKTLAGLQPPLAGSLSFNAGSRPRIGYLPQQAELDRQFPLTVFDVVAMGCWPVTGLLRRIDRQQRLSICQALERVGLARMPDRPIEALSGGQFQRMLFARLLVQRAPLMLLDEPFTGIDSQTCALLMTVMEQLHAEGHTLLVVLHDHRLVARHFRQVLQLAADDRTGRGPLPLNCVDPALADLSRAGMPATAGGCHAASAD